MTRLGVVCSLVVPADIIADVGCDHGKVAEYIAKRVPVKTVIASDISEKCLEKARAKLRDCDNVKFVCCDGIKFDCDEAVIAGMGGRTIIDILNAAKSPPHTLIVCAHRNVDSVRRELNRLGYEIDKDIMLEERGKFYSVIRAERCEKVQQLSELQYLYGLDFAQPSETLKRYLIDRYNTYMRASDRNADKIGSTVAALKFQGVSPDSVKE